MRDRWMIIIEWMARVYYVLIGGAMFFKLADRLPLDWWHLAIASGMPALLGASAIFTDGVFQWWKSKRVEKPD